MQQRLFSRFERLMPDHSFRKPIKIEALLTRLQTLVWQQDT